MHKKGKFMKCPKCGKDTEWLRTLSRVDSKTMVCDECGIKEALDDAGLIEGSSVRKSILACVGKGAIPQERIRAIQNSQTRDEKDV